jgi:hypothetical protein
MSKSAQPTFLGKRRLTKSLEKIEIELRVELNPISMMVRRYYWISALP